MRTLRRVLWIVVLVFLGCDSPPAAAPKANPQAGSSPPPAAPGSPTPPPPPGVSAPPPPTPVGQPVPPVQSTAAIAPDGLPVGAARPAAKVDADGDERSVETPKDERSNWPPAKALLTLDFSDRGITRKASAFGAGDSELLYFDGAVKSVRTGEVFATLPAEFVPKENEVSDCMIALSNDGLVLAASPKRIEANGPPKSAALISTKAAKVVHQLDFRPPGGKANDFSSIEVRFMGFIDPRTLAVGVHYGFRNSFIFVISAADGKTVSSVPCYLDHSFEEQHSFSADKKYLACCNEKRQPVVLSLEKPGVSVALTMPAAGPNGLTPDLEALGFSPSSDEVAGLFKDRLIVWDKFGKIVLEESTAFIGLLEFDETIRWMADGKGWLINGQHLVLRKPFMELWAIQGHGIAGKLCHFLDENTLAVPFKSIDLEKVVTMPVPWERIRPTLAAIERNETALPRGENVVVTVGVGQLQFGTPQETQADIGEALVKALKVGGYTPSLEGKYVLAATYNERKGKTRPVEGTGVSLTETLLDLDIRLQEKATNKVLWQYFNASGRAYTAPEKLTNDALRDHTLHMTLFDFSQRGIPAFISTDPALAPLPIQTRFDH